MWWRRPGQNRIKKYRDGGLVIWILLVLVNTTVLYLINDIAWCSSNRNFILKMVNPVYFYVPNLIGKK